MICYSTLCESNEDNLLVSETYGDAAGEVVLAEIIRADGKIFAPESSEEDWMFETNGESLTCSRKMVLPLEILILDRKCRKGVEDRALVRASASWSLEDI